MQVYECSLADLERIVAGDATFALSKVGRHKHPERGQLVRLGSKGVTILEATCTFRGRVILGPDGVLRVLDARHEPGAGEPLALLLKACEQGSYQAAQHLPRLAERLGFDSYAELFAHEEAQQGGGSKRTLLREVVGWTDPQAVR